MSKSLILNNLWLKDAIDTWLLTEWYVGYRPNLPDLCVGKLPIEFRMDGIDQWKVWFVETPDENVALRKALTIPIAVHGNAVDFESGPDAAVSKIDSEKDYVDFIVAVYAPPSHRPDWPWITITRHPSVKFAGELSHLFTRGIYGYDIDMTEVSAFERIQSMQRISSVFGGNAKFMYQNNTNAENGGKSDG